MLFDTAALPAHDCYQLLTHAVSPRPIAWICTRNADQIINLAPFSFFTVASIAPPVLLFTQVNPRDGQLKDTLRNLRDNGECVVNIVSPAHLDAMNQSCAPYPPHISELAASGMQAAANPLLSVPGVADAPVRFLCRLRDMHTLSPQPMGGTIVLLDVLAIEVEDALLHDGKLQSARLQTVGKLGADDYCHSSPRFSIARPTTGS